MEFLDSKREENNLLFRKYRSSINTEDENGNFIQLLNHNLDLVSFTIFEEFPKLKYHKKIYEVGIVGLILAIENYELDKFSSFEEFIVANIKNEIEKSLKEVDIMFVVSNENKDSFNYGDIWYSKTHLLDETINTKKLRDQLTKRLIKNL